MHSIRLFSLLFIVFLLLSGCTQEEVNEKRIAKQKQEIALLENEIVALEEERSELDKKLLETKINKGLEKYTLTLEIRQSHFTLDLGQHVKDEMNAITLQIPVDKDYYDSFEVGDTIDDSFRMGSFVLTGSLGSWDITVLEKEIK